MNLSPTLCKLKSSKVVFNYKHLLGIFFQQVSDSGLEIFLNDNGIIINSFHLLSNTVQSKGRFSGNAPSFVQQLSISFQLYSAHDHVMKRE
jgi:hypothetical protein